MRMQRLSDDAIAEQLGEALRERRLHKNITQDALAEQVGVSTPTIQKLERGKGTLQLLVAVLRELNSLELLSSLVAPPRTSPLAAAKTGRTGRARAVGTRQTNTSQIKAADGDVEKNATTTLKGNQADQSSGTRPLLIPRKT